MENTSIIQLPGGPIKALSLEDDLVHARGVPYAKADRFQEPQPADTWTEVRDCTAKAPLCPQLPSRLEAVMGPVSRGHGMDENCLHLSITAPKDAKNAPVLVWIHGGAYITGGGDLDCYQPIDLAKRGVVCVTLTYRLGVFGYLPLEGIAPPNLGLLDQRAALRWIQENISAFGGDPGNVTITGQSAGGDSIVCLLVSEGTAGLFHRAILLSPPLRDISERSIATPSLSTMAEQFLTKDPRSMTVDELLDVQKKLLLSASRSQIMLFAPQPGLYPLPPEPEFEQKIAEAIKDIPVLIGWTAHDGRPFSNMLGPVSLYKLPIVGPLLESAWTWYITRSYFQWPSQRLHEQILEAGGTSTSYSFEWAANQSGLGACHCIDIPFVLGSWDAWKEGAMVKGDGSKQDVAEIGNGLKDLWVDFANGRRLKSDHITIDRGFVNSQQFFRD